MDWSNCVLDDISAVIGYSATSRLSVWYEGRSLYIPCQVNEDHLLVKLLGLSAARTLVAEFAGDMIKIPKEGNNTVEKRRATIWRMMKEDKNQTEVAKSASSQLGISYRRANQIISELKQAGLLPDEKV